MKTRIVALILMFISSSLMLIFLSHGLHSQSLAQDETNPTQQSGDASLPDLDVTYIERQPMYSAYCVEYRWGEEPGMPGRPYLCPGTENERRWPEPSEVVTFTAHIANKGSLDSPAFGYAWLIDETVVVTGSLPAIAAGETITTTYAWPWAHGLVGERLTGTHTVGFTADPAGAVAESFESNNNLTDRTDAASFQIGITPQMVLAYNEPVTTTLPRSAEDWFQKQIKALNNALSSAVYPATPSGAVTQVRINRFVVRETPIEGDRSHDGSWFVDADYRTYSAYYDKATDIDWAWIHEMSHQISLIDLYMSNVEAPFNQVLNREGLRMNIGFHWPATNAIMFGGDTSPYTAPWVYDSHTAGGAKSNFGYRNGFYGAYQFDIPQNNRLLILDNAGQPAEGVEVSLNRKLNLPGVAADLDNTPEISSMTDLNGLFSLPNLPANGGTTTPTGHILHDNPFGMVDIVGEQNRYLVKIIRGDHEEFQWLDITPFNLAFWQGQTNDYTHTISTHLPVTGAPLALQTLKGNVESTFMTIYWGEYSIPELHYNVYRMGPPDFQYVKVSEAQLYPWYAANLDEPCFYLVTVVDALGRESGFSNPVWLTPVNYPVSVVAEKNGNLLVLDNLKTHQFSVLSPTGRWLYVQPLTEYFASRFFAINPAGLLLFSQPHDGIYGYNSILVYDPQTEASLMVGGRDDSPLSNPTGVAWWGEKTYSVSGPYALDDSALFLAHFDGSFTGARGEAGVSNGVTFTGGKFGQAALFDNNDTLSYSTQFLLLGRSQGTIEFSIQPSWNGNDNQDHTFFEVGDAWNNGIQIIKDAANNLKLMVWDTQGHEYGVFCPVGSWKAGDWHHVAASWIEHWMMLAVDGMPCKTSLNGGLSGISIELPPPLYVGNSKNGDQPAQAVIDELRISDYVRFGNTDQLRILVADAGMTDSRIVALDGMGNLVTSFGSTGSGNDQLNDPRGLIVTPSGEVIIVDRGNNRLQVLDFDGAHFTYRRTLTGDFDSPTSAAYYLGWIVVADTGNNAVKVLDPFGNLAGTYLEPDADVLSTIPFLAPEGVAVTRRGKIVVADSGRARVVGIAQNPLPKNFTFLPVTRR